MKSLVIGIHSLSGTYMTRLLKELNCPVVGTVLPKETCVLTPSEVESEVLDLLDLDSIVHVLTKHQPDFIFNFGAQSSVDYAWKNPGETVEVNVNGALNLFEAIRIAQINPVVILVGAGEEYGRVDFHHLPAEETVTLAPGNIYAATKACQSMMAQIYHKAYGLRLIVARTFNIIGPGQSEHFAVSNFCKQAVEMERGNRTAVFQIGNPNIQRDFTDIRDVVRAYWMLAQNGKYGEVYNVGSGTAVSIRRVLKCIQQQLPFDTEICLERVRMRPVDTPLIVGDIQKLKDDVGWHARISLEQSIRDILAYWRGKEPEEKANI